MRQNIAIFTDQVTLILRVWGKEKGPEVNEIKGVSSLCVRMPTPTLDPVPSLRASGVPLLDAYLETTTSTLASCDTCSNCSRARSAWECRYTMATVREKDSARVLPDALIFSLDAMPSCGDWMCIMLQRPELDMLRERLRDAFAEQCPVGSEATTYSIDTCVRCHKVDKLLKCSKCLYTRYCSAQCQLDDWPHHKHLCKKVICFAPNADGAASVVQMIVDMQAAKK